MSYRRTAANTSPTRTRGPGPAPGRLARRGESGQPTVARGTVSTPARALLIGASAIRIAYGAGSLLEPQGMVRARLAPDTHDLADPRLLLRAFGGHQIVAGALTLAATRSMRLARPAAVLGLLIDTLDVLSALLELRARGQSDSTTAGGIVISGSGVIALAAALRALGPRTDPQ